MELKMLADCAPVELIRVNLNEATEWAIVGIRSQIEFPIVAITGANSPLVVNALGDTGIKPEFESVPVLSYGKNYNLRDLLDAPCNVHNGPIFQQNGALIFTNEGQFLRCTDRDKARFLCLKTGVVRNVPTGHKAAFAEWGIWHESNEEKAILAFFLEQKKP